MRNLRQYVTRVRAMAKAIVNAAVGYEQRQLGHEVVVYPGRGARVVAATMVREIPNILDEHSLELDGVRRAAKEALVARGRALAERPNRKLRLA